LAAEIRDGFYLPLALFYLGLTRANRGRFSEALELAKRNNNAVALSRVPNGCGWVWREIGDLGKAIEFNDGSVEFSRRFKAAEAESNALINLVYDYLLAGEPAGALERVHSLYERERWNLWRFMKSGARLPKPSCGSRRASWIAPESTPARYWITPASTVCPNT
jgi:tetratricopeptide (TPR) repeat protein